MTHSSIYLVSPPKHTLSIYLQHTLSIYFQNTLSIYFQHTLSIYFQHTFPTGDASASGSGSLQQNYCALNLMFDEVMAGQYVMCSTSPPNTLSPTLTLKHTLSPTPLTPPATTFLTQHLTHPPSRPPSHFTLYHISNTTSQPPSHLPTHPTHPPSTTFLTPYLTHPLTHPLPQTHPLTNPQIHPLPPPGDCQFDVCSCRQRYEREHHTRDRVRQRGRKTHGRKYLSIQR